jgi:hypothetical protein
MLFVTRFFGGVGRRVGVAGSSGMRSKRVGGRVACGRVGADEKSCKNWRRGEGPGCFGVVRECPCNGFELRIKNKFIRW